ncbi:polysaccharide biosynthesis protein [Tepidibacter mesophilus]|uniref:polysaccharide biosynthesis protein n=1 Tax=Tepidibacter mesophilus TaxID=655607 RepID=UPI000C075841
MSKVKIRQIILVIVDSVLISLCAYISMCLIFDFNTPNKYIYIIKSYMIAYIFATLIVFYLFKFYSSLWRYASIEEMLSVVIACVISTSIWRTVFYMYEESIPIGFYIVNALILTISTGGVRFTYRVIRRIKGKLGVTEEWNRVLVIGGGSAGAMVIKEIRNNPQIKKTPVAVIDDDINKKGRRIHGVLVYGTRKDIEKAIEDKNIDEIVFAMPSISTLEKKELIDICKNTKCKLKTLPGMYELIDGRVDIKKIRDIQIEDLLGRDSVKVDLDEVSDYLENEVVLVTGGGGSIGSELCRQISRFKPKELIILDIYENNAYEIQQELKRKYKNELNLKVIIASVRDNNRMEEILKKYKPNVVFHAAAHKHVPLMEDSPTEAIKNNVFGTMNVAKLSDKYKVKKFVLISTDKAVNPTNIMGATKRTAELIIQTLDKCSETEFAAVRFGNVLGSNGSVVPLFKRQILEGGPVTVTHPDIIRYFMTIPEAVQLVIQAGAMANGGEIFVLDMGEPVKIADLAKDIIRLSGFEPDVDIKINYTGLRPGEKLYEELLMAEEGLTSTKHEKIFIGQPIDTDINALRKELEMLEKIVRSEEEELLNVIIKKLVPTYREVAVTTA